MSALRSLLFLLFQLVVTPLYAAAMLLMAWSPRITTYRMAASWCAVNLWGARTICGIKWQVDGSENVPEGSKLSPHIVLSKHSSTWETLSLNFYFPPLAFVAKKELLSIPFFGWGFATASPITIDRKAGVDAMQQIATQGRERFKQGFWIAIYPEGTRIKAGTRAKYKTGGARLAITLDVPVIPAPALCTDATRSADAPAAHSCRPCQANGSAAPAVRLQQFVSAFGVNGVVESICVIVLSTMRGSR